MLSIPTISAAAWYQKMFFLAVPALLTFVVTITRLSDGLALWALGLTFLISQTGFQADIGPIRTSALEVVLLILLITLLAARRKSDQGAPHMDNMPGYKWLLAFVAYSVFILIVGLINGASVSNALIQFKGFLLYPVIIYLMLAGVRSKTTLWLMILYMLFWYIFLSGQALLGFVDHETIDPYGDLYRASADYAPINIFGISAAVVSVLAFGLSLAIKTKGPQAFLLRVLGVILAFGALTSVSRASGIVLLVGLSVLAFARGRRSLAVFLFIVVFIFVLFALFPSAVFQPVVDRLFQLSDSSTMRRWFYLESGWQTLLHSWFLGVGWGNASWYYPGLGLVPTGSIPWYHNDYLNLAVQVGLPGLLLYAGFWASFLRRLAVWLKTNASDDDGYVFALGGTAALAAVLTGAFFEHILWRPDMAGLVMWVAGIALVGTKLSGTENVSAG